jgi:hypothetical protein
MCECDGLKATNTLPPTKNNVLMENKPLQKILIKPFNKTPKQVQYLFARLGTISFSLHFSTKQSHK